jgi:hypothetical protein
MEDTATISGGIYLRWETLQEFMGVLSNLTVPRQADLLGTNYLALHRARRGGRIGDRTIASLMTGIAKVAVQLHKPAPTFEELFEIRADNEGKVA